MVHRVSSTSDGVLWCAFHCLILDLFGSSQVSRDLTQYDHQILKEFIKWKEENKQLIFGDF